MGFSGTILFNTLQWKQRIDTQIKLNAAYHAIRTLEYMVSQETTYFLFLFQSVMSYDIIVWSIDRRVSIF